MKETFVASAKKLPDGMQVEVSSRSFTFLLDEPKELGGTDKAMNPVEAIMGALGACQTICAMSFAKSQGINLEGFHVELEGDLDPDGFKGKNPNVRNGFSEIRYTMHFKSDAPKEKLEAFADYIEKVCPVGDNLSRGVPLIRAGIVAER